MPGDDAFEPAVALADYLAQHLPLVKALGVRVAEASDATVRLEVPLEPNLNHEQTAFGGSIAAVGMLGGWGLIWVRARSLGVMPRLVIAESQTRYIRPIDQDFAAECTWPGDDVWRQSAVALRRHGRARIELRTELSVDGKVAAVHDGTFAVLRPQI